MSHGQVTVYTQTMPSGATVCTNFFDLGRAYRRVYLEIPTFASGADVFIQGSRNGTTFRRIYKATISTATVQSYPWQIGSASSQSFQEVPPGFRYYRPEISTALTDTVTPWNMICSD